MTYKYFAFISYSHTDKKEAKRLQRLVERYSLPAALRKRCPDAPKHFHLFRDDDELVCGELPVQLKKALEQSKWLVVICSPDSAKSEWVGKEIAHFRAIGRSKEIKLFIIKGEPHVKDKDKDKEQQPSRFGWTRFYRAFIRLRAGKLGLVFKELWQRQDKDKDNACFNPQLPSGVEQKLLGANVQKETLPFGWMRFHKAFIRLMAGMLGLDFNELWQRRKRYLRRLRALQITVTVLILGAIGYALNSRPFDLGVRLQTSIKSLPLSVDSTDILYLYLADDDVRAMPITNLDSAIMFPNIPGKYRNAKTRIMCKAFGFNSLDTLVNLQKEVTLPVTRDVETFGRLRVVLPDNITRKPYANAEVDFGFMKAKTDANGILDVLVPLDHQLTEYSVKITHNGKPLRMTYGDGKNMLKPMQSPDTIQIYVEP